MASFTEHNVFNVHPLIGDMYQPFIPFHGSVVFHCVKYTAFCSPSISWWTCDGFHFNCGGMLLRAFVYKSVVVFFISPGDLPVAEFAE